MATKAIHECLFCPRTFDSAARKDDHVLEHFAQEICIECDRNLIRIGSNLYTLHDAETCTNLKKLPVVCKRQSLSLNDDEDDHISAFLEEDLLESTDVKPEPIDSNEPLYDIPDLDDMSVEFELVSIVKCEDESVSNEFTEPPEYENEDGSVENYDIDSDNECLLDEETYKAHFSSVREKYSFTLTGQISCPICNKKKTKMEYIRKHMKWVHDPSKKFKCAHCRNVFIAESSAKNHLPQCKRRKELNYGDEIHEDDIIEFHGTTDLETYNRYWSSLLTEADIGQFECPICQRVLGKLDYLLRHMKLQHDPSHKNLKCSHCDKIFPSKPSYWSHRSKHKRDKESAALAETVNEPDENQECETDSAIELKKYNEIWSQLPEDKSFGRFTCPICKNIFTKKIYLLKHMKMQHDPSCKKFKCAYCKNKYLSESSLENHIPRCRKRNSDIQTNQLVDNTVNPNYVSRKPVDLKTYQNIYSRIVNDISQIDHIYECPICIKKVGNMESLRKHMKFVHDPSCKKFKCIYCTNVLLSEYSLEKHLRNCRLKNDSLPKLVNQFECPICKKKLAKKTILRAHIKRQHDPNHKTFKCGQCKRIFSIESSLEDHFPRCKKRKAESEDGNINCKRNKVEIKDNATKTPNELHICYLCVTIFQSGDELMKHKLDCKPNQSKLPFVEKYECYICHINFKRKGAVKTHLQYVHDPEQKRVTCELCEKQFHVKYIQTHHRTAHTNFRKFLCTICGHGATTKSRHTVHMLRHTGKKPLECIHDGCTRRFVTSSDRASHMRTHTGERPFECLHDGCTKRFKESSARIVHMRSHTGERPYHCIIDGCDRRFICSSSFRKHTRNVHGLL